MAVLPCPGDDNAAFIRRRRRRGRRVHRDNDPLQRRHSRDARAIEHSALPEGAGVILQYLRFEFLPPQAGAVIAAHDGAQEARRQIGRVGAGAGTADPGHVVGHQALQGRERTRRGGDNLAGPVPQPQAELQHVPCLLHMAPFGELIRPGGVDLMAAQGIGVLR